MRIDPDVLYAFYCSARAALNHALRRPHLGPLAVAGVVAAALAFTAGSLQRQADMPVSATAAVLPPAPPPEPATPAWPASVSLRVSQGDTLVSLLTDTGVSPDEAHQAVRALRQVFDPRRLDAGDRVAVQLNPSPADPTAPTIQSLTLPVSNLTKVELERVGDGFKAKKIETPVTRSLVRVDGMVSGSFYETGASLGIPLETLNKLVKVYSYDIDFQRDLKRGHRLVVVMEKLSSPEGKVVGFGNVVYSSLEMGKRNVAVYRHVSKDGRVDYYNEKGESLRKALLRTPINGARITSGFGMRNHPIMGYSKMHRGVDFGAATGTPIYAAGDGVVAYSGWKNGYGNYVQVKHNDKYATAYAHASRIAKGIKPGARVKQGQVIAYVGSTGQSTGPHLHYEVLVNGGQVNPAGVKFKTGTTLSGKELAAFKATVGQVKLALGKTKDEKKVASR